MPDDGARELPHKYRVSARASRILCASHTFDDFDGFRDVLVLCHVHCQGYFTYERYGAYLKAQLSLVRAVKHT